MGKSISIFHGYMVWIDKSVMRVTDWHHKACRMMPNSDPEGRILFLAYLLIYHVFDFQVALAINLQFFF